MQYDLEQQGETEAKIAVDKLSPSELQEVWSSRVRHIAQLEAAEDRDLEVHEFVNQWSHLYPDEAVRWFQQETKILRSLVMVKDIQRMTDSSVRLVPKLKTWNTHKKVKKVNLVPVEHCKRNATGPHGDARPKKRPRPMPKN